MHRWTARFLLVLSLVGILAPAALAVSAVTPRACCLRKAMHCHSSQQAQFQTSGCCGHDCCRSLTVSQFAEQAPAAFDTVARATALLIGDSDLMCRSTGLPLSYSGRAPPISLLG